MGSYHREDVIAHYDLGDSCACCGSQDRLRLDHVWGTGSWDRRLFGEFDSFCDFITSNAFPSEYAEAIQMLCVRCNSSKHDGLTCKIHKKTWPDPRPPFDSALAYGRFVLAQKFVPEDALLVFAGFLDEPVTIHSFAALRKMTRMDVAAKFESLVDGDEGEAYGLLFYGITSQMRDAALERAGALVSSTTVRLPD